jgi:hypothetical protein
MIRAAYTRLWDSARAGSDVDRLVRVEIQGAWLHNLPWDRAAQSNPALDMLIAPLRREPLFLVFLSKRGAP